MKKLLSIVAALAISMSVVTGCAKKEKDTDLTPAATSDTTVTQDVKPATTDVDTSKFIGEAKAQEIALEKAGITDEDVIFEKVELEKDYGVWKYEIEFRKDRTEYDAEINAEDGTIISWEVDLDD